jgi:uncharacterized protein YjdB
MRTARTAGAWLATALAAALVTACKDEILKVVEVALVEISGAPATLQVGSAAQLTANPKDDRGNRLTGRNLSWQTSNSGIAQVSAAGLVTGITPGNATITASSEGKSGSVSITITPVPIASIVVAPPVASLQIDGTVQLTATARDAAGNTLTGRIFTWTSADNNVATVSATGLVTGRAAGSVQIRATAEGITGAAQITVTAPVATVTVAPPTATLDLAATVQLVPTARDAAGNVLTGRSFTYSTANALIATVSPAGLVTGTGVGSVIVTATSEGKSGTALITVAASKVAMAYAYANQSTTPVYTPPGAHLAGGTMQVTRTAVGQYTVVFNGLGLGAGGFGSSFTVQVSGNSTDLLANLTVPTALCNLSSLNVNAPVTATVRCEDPATGADKDARFRVLVVGDNAVAGTGAPSQQGAFSAHTNTGQPAGSPYTPSTAFAWNSANGAMSVNFQGGSLFTHTHGLSIQSPSQGRLASGLGTGNVCYPQAQTATTTTVRCLNRAGAAVNTPHLVMAAYAGRPGKVAGYAHVDAANGAVFTAGSFNSTGGAITATRVSPGKFQVSFAGLNPAGQVGIIANVQGGAGWFACNHFLAGTNPLIVEVACFNPAGAFADPTPAFSVFVVE